jgi:hypothetical protein
MAWQIDSFAERGVGKNEYCESRWICTKNVIDSSKNIIYQKSDDYQFIFDERISLWQRLSGMFGFACWRLDSKWKDREISAKSTDGGSTYS